MTQTSILFRRTFLAIPLPVNDPVKKNVERWQKVLDRSLIKWVPPDQCHITLFFFGETFPEKEKGIATMVRSVFTGVRCFDMGLRGMGFFGSLREPKVFWIGIHEPEGILDALKVQADRIAAEHGFLPEQRDFKPHLTLARPKKINRPDLLKQLVGEDGDRDFGSIKVEKIVYYDSRLTPEGPVYTPIETVLLKST